MKIIAGTENITEKVIFSADQFKVISRYGVGIDNIDLKAANEKGVLVYNTSKTLAVASALEGIEKICKKMKKSFGGACYSTRLQSNA